MRPPLVSAFFALGLAIEPASHREDRAWRALRLGAARAGAPVRATRWRSFRVAAIVLRRAGPDGPGREARGGGPPALAPAPRAGPFHGEAPAADADAAPPAGARPLAAGSGGR